MELGFIGLGNLGAPMAENLLQQHKNLKVYNRTISKTKAFEEKGARVCKTVKELVSACDVVFTIVSNDAALKQITEGADGIAANLKTNGIHVSMSTILPATSAALFRLHQQYNNHYIASPVAGRPEAAKEKKLNFMISGDDEVINIIKPLLYDAGAAGIWEYGKEPGASNVAKLCTNYMILAALQSMAEGINLAEKSGIDKTVWMKMITSTMFNCGVYINYGNILLKEAYKPAAFTLELGLKDASLISKQADTAGAKMLLGAWLRNNYSNYLIRVTAIMTGVPLL